MFNSREEILSAALLLPLEARAELAEQIIQSLDGPEQDQVDAAWAAEIERRIARLDRGETRPIPGDEVMKKLWDRAK